MIQHPYWRGGEFQADAHDAAVRRAAYYGTLGLLDPRTYTVEPWLFHRAGMSWGSAVATSLRMAVWTVPIAATLGYLGYDPLNVTPGYGLTSERETSMDPLGNPLDFGKFDYRQFLM